MNRRPSLRTIAITLTCLLLPLTLLAGAATGAFYASTNPDNIDITTDLAYLRQTMTVGIIVFSLTLATIVSLIVAMYRRDRNFLEAKLPLVLLVAVLGILGLLLLVNAYTSSVHDQYLKDNGRPTLDEYFEKLETQQ